MKTFDNFKIDLGSLEAQNSSLLHYYTKASSGDKQLKIDTKVTYFHGSLGNIEQFI